MWSCHLLNNIRQKSISISKSKIISSMNRWISTNKVVASSCKSIFTVLQRSERCCGYQLSRFIPMLRCTFYLMTGSFVRFSPTSLSGVHWWWFTVISLPLCHRISISVVILMYDVSFHWFIVNTWFSVTLGHRRCASVCSLQCHSSAVQRNVATANVTPACRPQHWGFWDFSCQQCSNTCPHSNTLALTCARELVPRRSAGRSLWQESASLSRCVAEEQYKHA